MFHFALGRIEQIREKGSLRHGAGASEHAIDICVFEWSGM
jgi:hypothetical protein